ncbi:MAG: hypothetical protein ACOC0P_04430 [Planctomycetota bacterium]
MSSQKRKQVQTLQEGLNYSRFLFLSFVNGMIVMAALAAAMPAINQAQQQQRSGGAAAPAPAPAPAPGSSGAVPGGGATPSSSTSSVDLDPALLAVAGVVILATAFIGAGVIRRIAGFEVAQDAIRPEPERANAFLRANAIFGAILEAAGLLGIIAVFLGEPEWLALAFASALGFLIYFPRKTMYTAAPADAESVNPYATLHSDKKPDAR